MVGDFFFCLFFKLIGGCSGILEEENTRVVQDTTFQKRFWWGWEDLNWRESSCERVSLSETPNATVVWGTMARLSQGFHQGPFWHSPAAADDNRGDQKQGLGSASSLNPSNSLSSTN